MKSRHVMEIAEALVGVGLKSGCVPQLVGETRSALLTFAANPDLCASFGNPGVPLTKRREALVRVFKDEVGEEVQNALSLLMESELLEEAEAFFNAVVRVAEERAGHREALVSSAIPLKAEERRDLQQVIQEKFGGTVNLREEIHPEILGGLIISIGDWCLDASLKGRIERLKQVLST